MGRFPQKKRGSHIPPGGGYGPRRGRRTSGYPMRKRMSSRYGGRIDRQACLAGRKPEIKYYDAQHSTSVVSTSGTLISLADIEQGTTAQKRNGRRCIVTSVSIQGTYGHVNSLGGALPNAYFDRLHFMLVQDKSPNLAFPGITDILAAQDPDAYLELDNPGRFVVHAQKHVVVNPRVISGDGGTAWQNVAQRFPLKMHVDLCMEMEFNDDFDDGRIQTQSKNSLIFVAIADQGTATNFEFQFRLRFVD